MAASNALLQHATQDLGKKLKSLSKAKNMSIEEQFRAAVDVIRSLPKDGPFQPSDDVKLKFYAYFKQATEGPNETPKPAFYSIVNKYKWDAWKKLANMSKEMAMECYVQELLKIVETMSVNEKVTDFLEVLGPFYEFLPPEHVASLRHQSNKLNGDAIMPVDVNINGNTNGSSKTMNSCLLNGIDDDHSDKYSNEIDSDADEFSDTYDHIGEDGEIPIAARNGSEQSNENMIQNSILKTRGGNESSDARSIPSNESRSYSARPRNVRETRNTVIMPGSSSSSGGAGGGGSAGHSEYPVGMNEQLALAVIRLQQSMEEVMNRVVVIENILTDERHQHLNTPKSHNSPKSPSKWWPLSDLKPQTLVLMLAWPFVAHWLIHIIQSRRKK